MRSRNAANEANSGLGGKARREALSRAWIFGAGCCGEHNLAVLDIVVTPGRQDVPRTLQMVKSSTQTPEVL